MDIWEKLYQRAEKEYHPEDVSPFIYAHHVADLFPGSSAVWRQYRMKVIRKSSVVVFLPDVICFCGRLHFPLHAVNG